MPDVRPGQKLRISASEWNAVRRAAGAVLPRSGGFGSALGAGPEKCIVRNDSEAALPQFAVVQLADAAADASEFRGVPPVVSAKPYEDSGAPFALLLQPLAAGETGLARHSGVFAARVQPSGAGGGYAMPSRGATHLVQIDVGPVPLIGAQPVSQADADGLVWAIVVLGSGVAAGPSVCPAVVQGFSAGVYTVDLYADGILSPKTGRAQLMLTEASMLSQLDRGSVVLAHLVDVGTADHDVEGVPSEEGG